MILSGMYLDFEDSGDSLAGADPAYSLYPQRQRCWGGAEHNKKYPLDKKIPKSSTGLG